MTMSSEERRLSYIRELSGSYSQGSLRLLIGAGASIPSGFPSWDTLNQRLLLEYVGSEHGRDGPWASQLPDLARQLYELFGRDGAAQFVRLATREDFYRMLARALYDGRSIEDLPVHSLQYQIAAMAQNATIATFNFEPLLELAQARLLERDGRAAEWRQFRWPKMATRPGEPTPRGVIDHLHGWIDPDGSRAGELVFTESDYYELAERATAEANQKLTDILRGNGAVLTIGVSLADPNLRRLLYLRQKQSLQAGLGIYTLQRQTSRSLEDYGARHWDSLSLKPIFVQEFDAIPTLLRDVAWGISGEDELPRWLQRVVEWRQSTLPDATVFSNDWQNIAHRALYELRHQLRVLFGIPKHEIINTGLFVPVELPDSDEITLSQIASSRNERSGDEAARHAANRSFRLAKGSEQGVAGVAFVAGNNRQVLYGEPGLDAGLENKVSSAWTSSGANYRDWRSVLAVPLLDSPDWLPVAVMTLTSNLPDPFWTGFGERAAALQTELHDWLRRTARWLLIDFLNER